MSLQGNLKDMEKGFDLPQAIAEADRCLLCHDAPCSKGCPAGTDPGTFIRKLRMKNVTGAIRTIKENNILGGACGVLCPTPRLCEKECSATGIGRPIAIGKIQRCLVEHGWETNFKVFKKPEAAGPKVAVVGSGPAGLSCAAELAKEGFAVTVFEAKAEPGGVIRYGVPAYRFDKKFMKKELEDVKKLGVKIVCNTPVSGKESAEQLLEKGFKAVFLATGLWEAESIVKDKKNLPQGVYSSVDFLAKLREEQYDAVAKEVKGKVVAVIGGGSVAMDCAGSALRLGAKDVYLVYRRSFEQMPAEEDERLETLNAGAHFLLLNQPVEYIAKGKKVSGIKLVRTSLGEPDASGRRKPMEVKGSEWVLNADVVVEAIGNKAPVDSHSWYPKVQLSDTKLIKVNPKTMETSVKGIFAGGDIVRGPALVVEAVQDGKVAAKAISEYLKKEEKKNVKK